MAGKKEAEKKGVSTEDLLREKMDELRSLKQELVDRLRLPGREEVPPR